MRGPPRETETPPAKEGRLRGVRSRRSHLFGVLGCGTCEAMDGLEYEQMMQNVLDAVAASQMDDVLHHLRLFMELHPSELDLHKIAPALAHAVSREDADVLRRYLLDYLPGDSWLPCYFAYQLHGRRIAAAGLFYEKALETRPNQADLLGDYAHFLQVVLGSTDQSEKFFLLALGQDPENVDNLRGYAYFLRHIRGRLEEAEVYEKRTVQAASS